MNEHPFTCIVCGSENLWRDATLRDGGDKAPGVAQVNREEDPSALVFRGRHTSETRAVVCQSCGFIHLFAKDPQNLNLERD